MMRRFIDLHCHCVPGIDDGADTVDEARAMLVGLRELGFELVVATPHMRTGLFDNTRADLQAAFAAFEAALGDPEDLPRLALSSEHYFDDVVYQRLLTGEALPYPGERAALVELYGIDLSPHLEHRFADLRRSGLLPVVAHPERYPAIWRSPDKLERLIDGGAAALMNTSALAGRYGRKVRRCAEELLERGLYHAACTDVHHPDDISQVARGMKRIIKRYGEEELDFLFGEGPKKLLDGQLVQV